MKRTIFIGFSALLALVPAMASAAMPSGSLIRSTGSNAVYYTEAGKRYAFPNEKVFKSWYPDFSAVNTISAADLATYTLAGNVTYKPATRLVKVTTDPKVYAVSQYGVLRWLTTENVAAQLFGADWATRVDDVPDTFFTNYTVGSAVGAAQDYNLNEEAGVATIGANLRPPTFVAPTLPTSPPAVSPTVPHVVTGVSESQATLNQDVHVFATVSNSEQPMAKIEVSDSHGTILKTCTNTLMCQVTYTVTLAPLSMRFHAVATDVHGATFASTAEQEGTLNVTGVTSNIQMSLASTEATAGARVSFTSNAASYPSLTSHKIMAVIPGEPNPVLWKDCGASVTCAGSTPFYRTTQLFSRVTVDGQMYQSPAVTIHISGGAAPKPVLSITGRPNKNQVALHIEAPNGETIGWSSLVEGTSTDGTTLALCPASCDATVQFSSPKTFTAFTDVGGKLEASNSVSVDPNTP